MAWRDFDLLLRVWLNPRNALEASVDQLAAGQQCPGRWR